MKYWFGRAYAAAAFVCAFLVVMMIFGMGAAFGQTTSTGSGQAYPNKPVRIVTVTAGGGGDIVLRLIAQAITGPLGQPVVVDNRGGIVAIETVARAQPDGYTLLQLSNNFWLLPFLQKVSYDPVRDFAPITLTVGTAGVLVVHPSLPVNSVKELIALAKAKPGVLNYASGNVGGSNHLAAELFKAMAGVNILRIPYSGTAPAINALLGGDVQMMFANVLAVTQHMKTGRLRGLAVIGAQPTALLPGLPTVAAAGVPGYESEAFQCIWAPAKTPEAIIKQLNQEIVRVLNRADIKENLFSLGAEVVGSSREELAAVIKSDMIRMGKVIKDAGIRAE